MGCVPGAVGAVSWVSSTETKTWKVALIGLRKVWAPDVATLLD